MIYRFLKPALLSVAVFIVSANMAWAASWTVGSGGTFPTINAAMTSTTSGKIVNNGDELDIVSNITENANPCQISKQVTVMGGDNTISITYPPLQINRGMCYFNNCNFYTSSSTADLVKIQAQHNSISFIYCQFKKNTNYGKLLNDGGTNQLIIYGCTFIKGEYGIYSSNPYVNDFNITMATTFDNCSKGVYLNRTTSAPATAWSITEYNSFQGGNDYCVYSAIAGANTATHFGESYYYAGGYKATSYPIYLAGHNDANIGINTFYKCTAASGSHKAWYNPAGASDNVFLEGMGGTDNNNYPNNPPTPDYCVIGNVP